MPHILRYILVYTSATLYFIFSGTITMTARMLTLHDLTPTKYKGTRAHALFPRDVQSPDLTISMKRK